MENVYDRAIKEVMEPSLRFVAAVLLGIQLEHTRELKDKIQVTLEREGDHVKMLVFIDQKLDCILHLEFHVKDENIWALMLLKKAMLYLKYGLLVKQYVIYMGSKKKLRFLRGLFQDEFTRHEFTVIQLRNVSWRKFLESGVPEVVSLAVLGDFGKDKPEDVLVEILRKLDELVGGQSGAEKHVTRLRIFSNLRNLQALTVQTIKKMAWTYDIKSDLLYQQGKDEGKLEGIDEGVIKGKSLFVENLLLDGSFSDEKIATLADVSLEFVKKVMERLVKEGKLTDRKFNKPTLNGHHK